MKKSDMNRVSIHYGKKARHYDHRWSAYLHVTLGEALSGLHLSGTERVLDVGCGTGELERMAIEKFPQIAIVGVDMTAAMLERAREKMAAFPRIRFETGEAEALPFEVQSYDVVILANVFHHVRHPETVLAECTRVLRSGGKLVLVDWCMDFWFQRWMHYWHQRTNPTYVKTYRVAEAGERLRQAGFVVEETHRFIAPPLYGMMRLRARKI
ncbi:MAG: class I SAM-dependent methyltransferase [Desulfobacterales bacterium]|nr:class I SAM-dependent methyltransferase [Desulfobacterales bacterium]